MTDWGFRATNDSNGSIQVDENYLCLHMVSKGTANLSRTAAPPAGGSGSFYPYCSAIVDITAQNPVIAVAASSSVDYAACALMDNSAGGNSWGALLTSSANAGTDVSCQWWAFEASHVPSGEAWGARVFNASGDLVFDSGWSLLKPVDFVAGGSLGAVAGTRTYNAGHQYAGLEVRARYVDFLTYYQEPGGGFGFGAIDAYYDLMGFRQVTNGIDIGAAKWSQTGFLLTNEQLTAAALIIDVTNL